MTKKRIAAMIISWVVACAALAGLQFGLWVQWNLFNWVPRATPEALGFLAGFVAVSVIILCLARATRGRLVHTIAFVLAVILVAAAIPFLSPEPLGNPGAWFSRRVQSPWWFRDGLFLVQTVPLIFLLIHAPSRWRTPVAPSAPAQPSLVS
ncbi:MAG: hypothetical protein V4662_05620 [Verrucomicrobiota bacterium]